ncbi:DHH family phosphoesterase [Ruminococcus sp. YE71]|uniref:DHH family phosphoesterase n=1 Tax=Ruminococcus sp. YE71 TaxID=244362 RepID=UPI0015876B77|nr:DHH family phosphoesterase [Ruminococcus sp. YE71]
MNVLEGHRVFIQTHNFPDPDALASALGVQKLLSHYKIKATIIYQGSVAKASTANMVIAFGISMVDLRKINDMTPDDYIITVDAQMNTSNIAETNGTVVACIDHHPTNAHFDYLFKDVRICGSCATIVADYFFSNGIELDRTTATSLMYGLKMDTENLTRGVTEFDAEMFYRLFYLCNNDALKTLSNQQMEFSELETYVKAIQTIKIYDGVGFSFIDSEVSDGLIATVCDFILQLVEVHFAITYGYKGNGLKFSVRSELDYLDAGNITSNALEGLGTGGGHAAMAGGFLSFDTVKDADFDLEEEIVNRFLNAVYFSRALQDALTDPLAGFQKENIT